MKLSIFPFLSNVFIIAHWRIYIMAALKSLLSQCWHFFFPVSWRSSWFLVWVIFVLLKFWNMNIFVLYYETVGLIYTFCLSRLSLPAPTDLGSRGTHYLVTARCRGKPSFPTQPPVTPEGGALAPHVVSTDTVGEEGPPHRRSVGTKVQTPSLGFSDSTPVGMLGHLILSWWG